MAIVTDFIKKNPAAKSTLTYIQFVKYLSYQITILDDNTS